MWLTVMVVCVGVAVVGVALGMIFDGLLDRFMAGPAARETPVPVADVIPLHHHDIRSAEIPRHRAAA